MTTDDRTHYDDRTTKATLAVLEQDCGLEVIVEARDREYYAMASDAEGLVCEATARGRAAVVSALYAALPEALAERAAFRAIGRSAE